MTHSNKLIVALLLAAFAAVSAAEQQRLPDLGAGGVASDINENQLIAGLVVDPATLQTKPALWTNGVLSILPVGQFENGFAYGLSSNGNVAGALNASSGPGTEPVVWIGGQLQLLPTLGEGGTARDVNANGDAVGEVILNGDRFAALWRDGKLITLPIPAFGQPDDKIWSSASSINNAGVIAGTAHVAFGSDSRALRWRFDQLDPLPLSEFLEPRAFSVTASGTVLFDGYNNAGKISGSVTDLGVITLFSKDETAISTRALTLNNTGSAAGYVRKSTPENFPIFQPVIWENGARRELEMKQPNIWGFTLGINDSGAVVGYVTDGKSGRSEATLWTAGPAITASSVEGVPGGQTTLSARVMNGSKPVSGRQVKFLHGGREVGAGTTDAQGWARLRWTIPASTPAGTSQYMASLGGSKYARGVLATRMATMAVTATAAVQTARPGQRVAVTGVLRNSSLNRTAPGALLSFRHATGSAGLTTNQTGAYSATLVIPANAKVGSRVQATVRFAGNAGHTSATATVTVTVR